MDTRPNEIIALRNGLSAMTPPLGWNCIRHSITTGTELAELTVVAVCRRGLSGVVLAFRRAEPDMDSSIRTTLWGAYAALILLVIAGLAVTVGILQSANRQDYRIVEGSGPLLKLMNSMDDDVMTMLGAARGYGLTQQSAFSAQYDD